MGVTAQTAFLFPGQGSQSVGMGKDFAQHYPAAREVFAQADDILGWSLSRLCFDGSQHEIDLTRNTQPAVYVCGIAILRALQSIRPTLPFAAAAGHSLGEFTALTAVGALPFDDGLRLVEARGRLMQQAGDRHPGAMAALLGIDVDAVKALCAAASKQTGQPVVVANDNCPGQVVISGDIAALEAAINAAQAAGVRRIVRLAVSIAAHSPLMQSAEATFRERLAEIAFQPPAQPVYGNVQAAPLMDVPAIREELGQQLTRPVRWTESVQAMIAAGVTEFVEFGPGDVLTGMLKRIDRSVTGIALNTVEALERLRSV